MAMPWNAARIHIRLTPSELGQIHTLLVGRNGPDAVPVGHHFDDYAALEEQLSDALALANWKRDSHEIELSSDEVALLSELVAAAVQPPDSLVDTIARVHTLTTPATTGSPG